MEESEKENMATSFEGTGGNNEDAATATTDNNAKAKEAAAVKRELTVMTLKV